MPITPTPPPSAHYSQSISSGETTELSVSESFTKNWPERLTGAVKAKGLNNIAKIDEKKSRMILGDLHHAREILTSALSNLCAEPFDDTPIKNLLYQKNPTDIKHGKDELIRVLTEVRHELETLEKSHDRIVWTDGSKRPRTLGATVPVDTDDKMVITDKYFDKPSATRASSLIHESTHLVQRSYDYKYASVEIPETQGTNQVSRPVVESSIRQYQEALSAESMLTHGLSKINVDTLNSTKSGIGKTFRTLTRDAGLRPHKDESYRVAFESSPSLRLQVGLNNPDNIVGLALAYGQGAILHDYPSSPSPPIPLFEPLHSDYHDDHRLDPGFGDIHMGDPDDDAVQNEINFRDARSTLLREHSTLAAIDLIKQLQLAEPQVRLDAAQDRVLLKELAMVAMFTDTTKGPAEGAEASAPLQYVANLARIALRDPQIDPLPIASAWYGNSGSKDSPASIILSVRALPAVNDTARTVFADLMRDTLRHPNMTDAGRTRIADLLRNDFAKELLKVPLIGVKSAHENVLRWMDEAGVKISKTRRLLGGTEINVNLHAPYGPITRPPEIAQTFNVSALKEQAIHSQNRARAYMSKAVMGASYDAAAPTRWNTMQTEKDRQFRESSDRFKAISTAAFRRNEEIAAQAQQQKAAHARAARTRAAYQTAMADEQRRVQNAVWFAEQATHSRAAIAEADAQKWSRQNAAIDSKERMNDFVHQAITSGGGTGLARRQPALSSAAGISGAQALPRATPQYQLAGQHFSSGRLALSSSSESSAALTLPSSTFTPPYQLEGRNMVINAQNRQGQPVRVEVPPPQGPGIIINYAPAARDTSLWGQSGTSAPHSPSRPTINYTSHHEGSGLPVIQLESASGDRFNAASYQGFTLREEHRTVTYNRRDPNNDSSKQ